jgi:hypothetical protein
MKPLISIENEETAIQAFNAALTHEKAEKVIIGDVSGSMCDIVRATGATKFDAMRDCMLRVVSRLENAAVLLFADRSERVQTWEAFNELAPSGGFGTMRLGGGTSLHGALRDAAKLNPEHIVVVTDGQPNSPERALAIARTMLCRIDVYYCGNGASQEVQFCRDLAQFGGEAVIDSACVTMLETVTLFLTDAAIAA